MKLSITEIMGKATDPREMEWVVNRVTQFLMEAEAIFYWIEVLGKKNEQSGVEFTWSLLGGSLHLHRKSSDESWVMIFDSKDSFCTSRHDWTFVYGALDVLFDEAIESCPELAELIAIMDRSKKGLMHDP